MPPQGHGQRVRVVGFVFSTAGSGLARPRGDFLCAACGALGITNFVANFFADRHKSNFDDQKNFGNDSMFGSPPKVLLHVVSATFAAHDFC